MEEIKVGEYVRLKDGIILKYGEKSSTIIENNIYTDYSGEYEWSSEVVKHSPNIIDLIEEGDYVNGRLIHKVDIRKNSSYIYYGNGKTFTDYQIEAVVTKEQFQSVKYRLEE